MSTVLSRYNSAALAVNTRRTPFVVLVETVLYNLFWNPRTPCHRISRYLGVPIKRSCNNTVCKNARYTIRTAGPDPSGSQRQRRVRAPSPGHGGPFEYFYGNSSTPSLSPLLNSSHCLRFSTVIVIISRATTALSSDNLISATIPTTVYYALDIITVCLLPQVNL